MKIINWKKFYNKKKPYDDGALISIRNMGNRKKSNFLLISKSLANKSPIGEPKAVYIFYSSINIKRGYLGIRFLNDRDTPDSYVLASPSKSKWQVITSLVTRFQERKYFDKEVKYDAKEDVHYVPIELKEGQVVLPGDLIA